MVFISLILFWLGLSLKSPGSSESMAYRLHVDEICLRDGKILHVKRACELFKGFWNVIGGKVQKNELFLEALRREFKEETI